MYEYAIETLEKEIEVLERMGFTTTNPLKDMKNVSELYQAIKLLKESEEK
jgi:superfamily II DNA or RNA helicase